MQKMILLLIIIVGTYLKFSNLDLMEFKFDEAYFCMMAYNLVYKGEIALTAGISSVGIPNPPLYIYILALPHLFSPEPTFIAGFLTLCDIFTIFLLYLFVKRLSSHKAGLISAALFSFNPWTISYFIKIHSTTLVFLFSLLFLFCCYSWIFEKKESMLFWVILLLACLPHFHLSCLWSLVFLPFAAFIFRPPIKVKYLILGIFISFILYLPFLLYLLDNFKFLQISFPYTIKDYRFTLLNTFNSLLNRSSLSRLDLLIGDSFFEFISSKYYFLVVSYLIEAILIISIFLIPVKFGKKGIFLILWFLIPIFGYSFLGIEPAGHYLQLIFPIQFCFIGLLFDFIFAKVSLYKRISLFFFLCSIFLSYITFSYTFFYFINYQGGGEKYYGVAYVYKKRAIEYILEESISSNIDLRCLPSKKGGIRIEYLYLLNLLKPKYSLPISNVPSRFLIVETLSSFYSPYYKEKIEEKLKAYNYKDFGPLRVYHIENKN